MLNENNKKAIANIRELELTELNGILSNIFASSTNSSNTSNFKCEICKNFIAKNKTGLNNHLRICKLQNISEDNSVTSLWSVISESSNNLVNFS